MDVYQHDSDLNQLENLESGLIARVVIDGWDKLIASTKKNQLFDLKMDLDDRNDLAASQKEKVMELSKLIENWVGGK